MYGCNSYDYRDPSEVAAPFGEAVPGLTTAELQRFAEGKRLFARQFSAEEGLGPRFNENSCNACHTDPADGGTGETAVTRATRTRLDGTCDALATLGGENLRIRTTTTARDAGARVPVPLEATHSARFTIPFLFGLGIVDAIPESALRALEDPDDANGDGISGRLGSDPSGRPARFGRKADVATLADFVEGAFRMEMGLTTATLPDEGRAGGVPALPDGDADPAAEPEVDQVTLDVVTDFMRLLAPPVRGSLPSNSTPEDVRRGEELFVGLNCVGCHVPIQTAGASPVAALSHASIALYSDLLLHDMGQGLEGTCSAGASTREYRTEPLMGLRARRTFMHDGRFGRVIDAIMAHDGEARGARDAFAALDRVTQELVIRFLDTL